MAALSSREQSPHIYPLGDSAYLVHYSSDISQAVNRIVLKLANALLQDPAPGILDIVPAYSSVLVKFSPQADPSEIAGWINRKIELNRQKSTEAARPPNQHIVPTVYGGDVGPDLERLAAAKGLLPEEVVKLHSETAYHVYFIGFMPGFAYMGDLSPNISTPRLRVPRTRVPRGSVGIAGNQTGIYPGESPGGWNIIGRTTWRPWSLGSDPPSLLLPGDSVLFRAVDSADFDEPSPHETEPQTGDQVLRVIDAGAGATVQDLGRVGLGRYGVPQGGALAPDAAVLANTLMGNTGDAAVLEIRWGGLELEALGNTCIALSGGDLRCESGHVPVPLHVSWFVRAGQTIRFAGSTDPRAEVGYLAVLGGLSVPGVLGSRSTLVAAGFGGYKGRRLKSGDILRANSVAFPPSEAAGRVLNIPSKISQAPDRPLEIGVVPYDGPASIAEPLADQFFSSDWAVGTQSNRVGTRLKQISGTTLAESDGGDITSFGMVKGLIQLPPGGEPVVLSAEHGTTGGYPVIGVVASADQERIGTASPGTQLKFYRVTLDEARKLAVEKARNLNVLLNKLARR